MLEDELSQIQLASSSVHGANSIEFDDGTLAVLRGRCVRYLMRSAEVIFFECDDVLMNSITNTVVEIRFLIMADHSGT